MTTYKAFKYKLKPTEDQIHFFEGQFGACRFVWNHFLDRTTKAYKRRGESMSTFDMMKILTQIKHSWCPWLNQYDNSALRQSIINLDAAKKAFFRRVKNGEKPGYPKFKSRKNPCQSFTTTGMKVTNKYIQLPKIGKVAYCDNRSIEGTPVEATVSRDKTGQYWVSVCCKLEVEPLPALDNQLGLDLGLKEFAVDSEAIHYENPKYYEKSQKKLRREQRRLSRRQQGSANYEQQRQKVAKLQGHVKNQRQDHHHKLSRQLVNETQVLIVEDLDIAGMTKSQRTYWSKQIADAGWADFQRMLEYKSLWAGRQFIKIPETFPSSQLCSECGERSPVPITPKVKTWTCPHCGVTHDRKENAARNILKEGLRLLQEAEQQAAQEPVPANA